MIAYDAAKPLISLHVPKCAGQSFRSVLEKWFGDRFFIHYYQQNNSAPPKHSLKPGICIHGHFANFKKFGVIDYYPEVDQFITILRDPLDAAVANYFYWKTKARARQLKNGEITVGGEHDYRSIDDFFRKRSRSNMLNFLPQIMTKENYQEILERQFVWIGLTENLQVHIDRLADILGFTSVAVERLNTVTRDEELSPRLRREFIENSGFEFELYRYVKDHLLKKEQ